MTECDGCIREHDCSDGCSKSPLRDDFLRTHVYVIGIDEGDEDNPDVTSDDEPELPDSEDDDFDRGYDDNDGQGGPSYF